MFESRIAKAECLASRLRSCFPESSLNDEGEVPLQIRCRAVIAGPATSPAELLDIHPCSEARTGTAERADVEKKALHVSGLHCWQWIADMWHLRDRTSDQRPNGPL